MSKNGVQRRPKDHEEVILEVEVFLGQVWENSGKNPLLSQKMCLLLAALPQIFGFFGRPPVLGIFGVISVRVLFLMCTRRRYAVRGVSDRTNSLFC